MEARPLFSNRAIHVSFHSSCAALLAVQYEYSYTYANITGRGVKGAYLLHHGPWRREMEISSEIQANKLLLIALLVSAATAVPSKCIIFKFGACNV